MSCPPPRRCAAARDGVAGCSARRRSRGSPGAQSDDAAAAGVAAVPDDGLGPRAGGPARVGERGGPVPPPGQDRAAPADLPPGFSGGQGGQPEVGHGVPADLVPVRGQLAQVGEGHIARRPDRAGDDVEGRGQPVAVQHPGRGHLVGVPVVKGQAHHGAGGGPAALGRPGQAVGGGGRRAQGGDRSEQGEGYRGQAYGQQAGSPLLRSLPSHGPLPGHRRTPRACRNASPSGDALCPPASDLRPG